MSHNAYGNMITNQMYPSLSSSNPQPGDANHGLDNLVDALGSMNLGAAAPMGQVSAHMQSNGMNTHGYMSNKALSQCYYQPSFVQYPTAHYNWANPHHAQYQQAGFPDVGSFSMSLPPNTPRGQVWVPSQGVPPVPELMSARRTSLSSKEESPQTPSMSAWQAQMLLPNHSPATWNTPSPMATKSPYFFIAKGPNGEPVSRDFYAWTHEYPAIPEPVPALHSGVDGGRGSLDKILDNREGTTNVYVRGLQPDTTDELLYAYGRRFGEIESQKAIIDHSNGTCKGFGFIKYHNFVDAENCIRGFWLRGYEAKFARLSHNARLKNLHDPENNNLYVSNLPKHMNEDGLSGIFETIFPKKTHPQYHAGSCKILKDTCGISRGVGFARFDTPEICAEIIEAFNNKTIVTGQDTLTLQIRYADTKKQKDLKRVTADKRQFKADEYNEAVYGIPFPHYSPVPTAYQSPLQARVQGMNGSWINQSPASSISPSSFASYPLSALRARHASSGILSSTSTKVGTETTPAPSRYSSRIKIESPNATAETKKAAVETMEDQCSDGESPANSNEATTLADQPKHGKMFHKYEIVSSPTKSML